MSHLLNIGGETDPFYRYKMPQMETKIEGRGNGIKTVLVNIEAVASALSRSTDELMALFKLKLGTRTKDHTLNGEFSALELQQHLATYISQFVLCSSCSNPETHYLVHKTYICIKCAACGKKGEKVDSGVPLKFILKQAQA